MLNPAGSITKGKFLGAIVLVFACVGIGYLASLMFYEVAAPDFATIQTGTIPDTHYVFDVEAADYGRNMYFIQNRLNQTKTQVVEDAESGLEYTLLKRGDARYLIVKRPRKVFDLPVYFVWNITGDKANFISSMISCQDPKLLNGQLEFQTNCGGAGEYRHDESVIELR